MRSGRITNNQNLSSSPNKILRIGVIGTGAFAEQCHLPGLQSHPQARVVALCGRRPERLRYLADQFNVPAIHTDYQELCAREDLDAITIVTSNHEHAEQALAGFSFGKHVFCEKPMATTVAQARKMVHAAEMSGKIHQVAFTYRYLYGVQELRRRINRGDIGEPFHLRAHWNTWEAITPGSSLRPTSGVLYDMGPHLFDLARFLLGPIQTVMGLATHVPPRVRGSGRNAAPLGTDDFATAWFHHESGVQGQWFASRVMPSCGEKSHIEVVGHEGALRASLSRGTVDVLRRSRPSKAEWEELPLPPEAREKSPSCLNLMMRSFVDACLRGERDGEVNASFHDGLASQLAIAAVEQTLPHLPWRNLDEAMPDRSHRVRDFPSYDHTTRLPHTNLPRA
jgi:predicted dehydrogenase